MSDGTMAVSPAPMAISLSPQRDQPWSCFRAPDNQTRTDLSVDDIKKALESQTGMLWVDVDYRNQAQTAVLSDVFHFHPLAIEDSLNPNSRVKIEEYSGYLILIVRTIAFNADTEDPYDIDTVISRFFLERIFSSPCTASTRNLCRRQSS
jgi:magnesium transporter